MDVATNRLINLRARVDFFQHLILADLKLVFDQLSGANGLSEIDFTHLIGGINKKYATGFVKLRRKDDFSPCSKQGPTIVTFSYKLHFEPIAIPAIYRINFVYFTRFIITFTDGNIFECAPLTVLSRDLDEFRGVLCKLNKVNLFWSPTPNNLLKLSFVFN